MSLIHVFDTRVQDMCRIHVFDTCVQYITLAIHTSIQTPSLSLPVGSQDLERQEPRALQVPPAPPAAKTTHQSQLHHKWQIAMQDGWHKAMHDRQCWGRAKVTSQTRSASNMAGIYASQT